jgi:hypothetical protein
VNIEALADDIIALRADIIAAGFAVLPRKVLELIQPLPDSVTTVVINKVTTCAPQPQPAPPQPPQQTAPLPETADVRSVAEVLAARKAGQPVPTGLEIAQQLAAKVETPDRVRQLEADTGYKVVPSHRGIEIHNDKRVRIAVVTKMEQAELLLMSVRVAQLQEMAS